MIHTSILAPIKSLRDTPFVILSCKSIGLEETKVLAEKMLRKNTVIISLDLSFNNIGDEGVKVLAETLRENTAITYLDLSYNNIGDKGAEVLAEMLRYNTTITCLCLGFNRIGLEGIKALADALRQNASITTLKLFFNPYGSGDKYGLRSILKRNREIAKEINPVRKANLIKAITGQSEVPSLVKQAAYVAAMPHLQNQIHDQQVICLLQEIKGFSNTSIELVRYLIHTSISRFVELITVAPALGFHNNQLLHNILWEVEAIRENEQDEKELAKLANALNALNALVRGTQVVENAALWKSLQALSDNFYQLCKRAKEEIDKRNYMNAELQSFWTELQGAGNSNPLSVPCSFTKLPDEEKETAFEGLMLKFKALEVINGHIRRLLEERSQWLQFHSSRKENKVKGLISLKDETIRNTSKSFGDLVKEAEATHPDLTAGYSSRVKKDFAELIKKEAKLKKSATADFHQTSNPFKNQSVSGCSSVNTISVEINIDN